MLAYARNKVKGKIDWRMADCSRAALQGRTPSALVVCGLGVMFVPDKPKLFGEARRVLMEGGMLLFNCWDRLEVNRQAQGGERGDAGALSRTTRRCSSRRCLTASTTRPRSAASSTRARFRDVASTRSRSRSRRPAPRLRHRPGARHAARRPHREEGVKLDEVIEKIAARARRRSAAPSRSACEGNASWCRRKPYKDRSYFPKIGTVAVFRCCATAPRRRSTAPSSR